MNSQEIAELAMWTARAIYDALKEDGVKLSAVEENLIATFVQKMLTDWQGGIKIDTRHMLKLVEEMETPQNHKLSPEILRVLTVFVEKFPLFVAGESGGSKLN